MENFCHPLQVSKNMVTGSSQVVMMIITERSPAHNVQLPKLTNDLFHFLQDLPRLDQCLHRIMIGIQWTIYFEVFNVFTDDFVRFLSPPARCELPEVKCLCGGHELDAQYAIGIIQDLPIL